MPRFSLKITSGLTTFRAARSISPIFRTRCRSKRLGKLWQTGCVPAIPFGYTPSIDIRQAAGYHKANPISPIFRTRCRSKRLGKLWQTGCVPAIPFGYTPSIDIRQAAGYHKANLSVQCPSTWDGIIGNRVQIPSDPVTVKRERLRKSAIVRWTRRHGNAVNVSQEAC